MKKYRWMIVLALLSSILCGCGSQTDAVRVPYLSQKERAAIESGILNDLKFVISDSIATVCFRNASDYTLLDLNFITKETKEWLCSVPYLEGKTSAQIDTYLGQELNKKEDVYIVYTIGEYTYSSEISVPIKQVSAKDIEGGNKINITVWTEDGPIQTDFSEPLEFVTGMELVGLTHTKIFSLSSDFYFMTHEVSGFLDVKGEKPARYYDSPVYKVYDEDGIVVYSGKVYISDGEGDIYLNKIPYGNYTLTFEEAE